MYNFTFFIYSKFIVTTLQHAMTKDFVQKMEFQLKDELVRSTIIQIEKSTEVLKEDILDNKQSIKELEDKVYKR